MNVKTGKNGGDSYLDSFAPECRAGGCQDDKLCPSRTCRRGAALRQAKASAPNPPMPEKKWIVVQVKSALGPAFRGAGLTRLRLDGKLARECVPHLTLAIAKFEATPQLYPAIESVPTWGTEGRKPLDQLKVILDAMKKNPDDGVKWGDR